MNHATRSALRAGVGVASLAALGVALAGTAAAEGSGSYPSCPPAYGKHDYSMPGYNGDKRDDRSYGSDDYRPDCTGFHGRSADNGYNGYDGKDQDRLDKNPYRFAPL